MHPVPHPVAPPIVEPTKDGYFVSGVKFGAKSVLNACRAYSFGCETGAAVLSGTFSCAKAVGRAALSTWNHGLQKSLGNIASSAFGIDNFDRAIEAIQLRTEEKRDFHGVLVKKEDKRDFAARLGEASAHAFNGTCRLIAVGGGAIAYAFGTFSNVLDLKAEPDSLHQAAKSIASGFNTIGSYMPSIAWNIAKTTGSAAYQLGSVFWENPTICTKGLLMVPTIYMATSNFTKVIDKPGVLNKLYHTACAITGLALTVAIAQAQLSSARFPTAYA